MTKSELDKIKSLVPEFVLTQINPEQYNKLELCHFLSQCAHESNWFKIVVENLNYSAQGLMSVFKKYFPTIEKANEYARQPEKIASYVYANRMGNGNEESKEGFKFRGRGYIQLTGKDNYTKFSNKFGVDCVNNPDLIATTYPLDSARFFFDNNNLWSICNEGNSVDVITKLTKRINGGTNGLDDRISKFNLFYSAL